ncbi:hypothetical protein MPNT_70086 [Candidatus Methylacidithermus pantelleriae]|uniref:Uncharacterized protein n=1 Tax=Candidatus Methylacidithermus pantelleriae TaxID=2744239 RepID=A0A8J2FTG5_9BACT|nr:hypothetical protein MPNT_70086 [Candidatus Methylacidithermus pantelleriae]
MLGPEDGGEIKLADHLVDEVSQLVRGQPVPGEKSTWQS